MKLTLLIIWNAVLTLVIAFFLYHILSEGKEKKEPVTTKKVMTDSDTSGTLRIAYVNMDSLQENYTLFAQKKKELEMKKQQSEAQVSREMENFQNDYAAAEQSASTMTEAQLQATQDKLLKKQSEIQQLQSKLQSDFQDQLEKFNKELKDSLDSFMKTYNGEKKFSYVLSYAEGGDILFAEPRYDITADAIQGLNARLKK